MEATKLSQVEFNDNVIELKLVKGKLSEKKSVAYNKDGSVCKRHSNAKPGVSAEVYPFNEDEVAKIISVLNSKIEKATSPAREKIARRNKLLAIVGLNSGLRASDIRLLTWRFFYDEYGKIRDFYSIEPYKTRKYKKFVKIFFNKAIVSAINEYVNVYPIDDYDANVFQSQKGDDAIEVHTIYDVIKKASAEAGIQKNVGSHSLRKTWGFTVWHNADDKEKALVVLQQCFNHSSTLVTARYIGIMDSEVSDMFNSVNIGYCY